MIAPLIIASCSDGDLKLVGSKNDYEGKLQICFSQRWTAIIGDGWGISDTQVACKQLGYPPSGSINVCMSS